MTKKLCDGISASKNKQNLFYSPLSIQIALAMLSVGARGKTRQELVEALELPENHNEYFLNKLKELTSNKGELAVANALWGQKDYKFNPSYQEVLKAFYLSQLYEVDFKDREQAVNLINNWISDNTKGCIPKILTVDAVNQSTRLVLTNAIYFRGFWSHSFDKNKTYDGIFHGLTSRTRVPMMRRSFKEVNYGQSDKFQALELPYENNMSMVLVLPIKADLEESWGEFLKQEQYPAFWRVEEVDVVLPRFKIECELNLNDVLNSIGCASLFSPQSSNLSGISEEKLFVSGVLHKACVDVNEEGTEAAAVTAVAIRGCSVSVSFFADRPFRFAIRKANSSLFEGRFVDF